MSVKETHAGGAKGVLFPKQNKFARKGREGTMKRRMFIFDIEGQVQLGRKKGHKTWPLSVPPS